MPLVSGNSITRPPQTDARIPAEERKAPSAPSTHGCPSPLWLALCSFTFRSPQQHRPLVTAPPPGDSTAPWWQHPASQIHFATIPLRSPNPVQSHRLWTLGRHVFIQQLNGHVLVRRKRQALGEDLISLFTGKQTPPEGGPLCLLLPTLNFTAPFLPSAMFRAAARLVSTSAQVPSPGALFWAPHYSD